MVRDFINDVRSRAVDHVAAMEQAYRELIEEAQAEAGGYQEGALPDTDAPATWVLFDLVRESADARNIANEFGLCVCGQSVRRPGVGYVLTNAHRGVIGTGYICKYCGEELAWRPHGSRGAR